MVVSLLKALELSERAVVRTYGPRGGKYGFGIFAGEGDDEIRIVRSKPLYNETEAKNIGLSLLSYLSDFYSVLKSLKLDQEMED